MMLVVYGQTDKLMLKQYLGETEVGYYATAISICSMWTFILQALIDSLYPTILQLNSTNQAAFDRKNRQLYAIVFYLSCFVSIGFTIFGDWGISLLYGAEYAPAGLPLKIITWYTAFSYLGVARNAWIVSAGKQRYLKYMYFSAAIINIILNCIFIPVLGAAGAAIASLITQVLTSLLLPSLIKEMRPNVKLMVDAILLRNVF
jgi:O-antigen/teichoic acid export membrane protein